MNMTKVEEYLNNRTREQKQGTMERIQYELLEGGDATIFWFLPGGGAYVFPGDGRFGAVIKTAADLEKYFCPSFTIANYEDLDKLIPGDGPDVEIGTKDELHELLKLKQ